MCAQGDVVGSREYYLGVSAAGLLSDRAMSLDQDCRSSISGGQLTGDGKSDGASPYDLHIVNVSISYCDKHGLGMHTA
jgi:hypothetical protein